MEELHDQPRHLPRRRTVTAEFVIGAYHWLFQIEASFRMSKHDLAAPPVKRDYRLHGRALRTV